MVPRSLAAITTNKGTSFLVINNEFRNDTTLAGFELYAATGGTITIQVVSSKLCGSLVPCANYFSIYPFSTSLNVTNTWNFTVVSGYNKLYLTNPINVFRGSFIYLTQLTGKIAIDQTGNSTYSDLAWNNVTFWSKLNEFSNWRFYLSAINGFSSYQTNINIVHQYLNTGLYTISISFLSSDQLFQQLINITDCKSLF